MGSTAQDLNNSRKGHRRGNHRTNSVVTWQEVDCNLIRMAIECVAKAGGALRFGYTRDQGAFALGVYGEGDPYTEYEHEVSGITEILEGIVEDYSTDGQFGKKLGL